MKWAFNIMNLKFEEVFYFPDIRWSTFSFNKFSSIVLLRNPMTFTETYSFKIWINLPTGWLKYKLWLIARFMRQSIHLPKCLTGNFSMNESEFEQWVITARQKFTGDRESKKSFSGWKQRLGYLFSRNFSESASRVVLKVFEMTDDVILILSSISVLHKLRIANFSS